MTANRPKFRFFEIVRVAPTCSDRAFVGLRGAVLGQAQHDDGTWSYGVHVYDQDEVVRFLEHELVETGAHDVESTFYDGTTLRVHVDPETGEGWIVDGREDLQGPA